MFCLQKLKSLTVGVVRNHINDNILNAQDDEQRFIIKDEQREKCGIVDRSICTATAHEWLMKIGCKAAWHKKSFYVDNHESEKALKQRARYLKSWKETQLYEYLWLQFSTLEDKKWRESARKYLLEQRVVRGRQQRTEAEVDLILASIKPTREKDGVLEYHVDDCDYFHVIADLKHPKTGGNLSIDKPPFVADDRTTWLIMVIGEDEAVFKSGTFRKSCWSLDGTCPLFPKSQGRGLHVAAFHSRKVGLHFSL